MQHSPETGPPPCPSGRLRVMAACTPRGKWSGCEPTAESRVTMYMCIHGNWRTNLEGVHPRFTHAGDLQSFERAFVPKGLFSRRTCRQGMRVCQEVNDSNNHRRALRVGTARQSDIIWEIKKKMGPQWGEIGVFEHAGDTFNQRTLPETRNIPWKNLSHNILWLKTIPGHDRPACTLVPREGGRK